MDDEQPVVGILECSEHENEIGIRFAPSVIKLLVSHIKEAIDVC